MTANAPEVKPEAPIVQEKVEEKIVQQPAAETVVDEDPNFKAFREGRKKDRADKEAAERRAAEKEAETEALKRALEAVVSKPQPQSTYQNDYQYAQQGDETEEQRITKEVERQLAQREQANERARQEYEQKYFPNRLVSDFPDFNQVCSPENIDYLEFHHKEVARPLNRLQEGYDKWADIYHAIKKYVPNNSTAKREAARADANMLKPKSISSSAGMAPGEQISSAILSQERKDANYARMQKMLKSVG